MLKPAIRPLLAGVALMLAMLLLAGCLPATPDSKATSPVIISTATQAALPPTATTAAVQPTAAPAATQTPAPGKFNPVGTAVRMNALGVNPDLYAWKPFAAGFSKPVYLEDLGGGKLLVLEQGGVIRLLINGAVQPTPFLDLSKQINSSGSEQGLLGIALHPQFAQNRQFFLHYSDLKGNTVLARLTARPDLLSADPASTKVLLQVEQPFANHNGGQLAFGPDGFLYIGLGDGGSSGDPRNNAQTADVLLGKILRFDVNLLDNATSAGAIRPEVWGLGLRNPWRFSFDRQTGDLYIGDVGQNTYEEIDFLPAGTPAGTNFGWRWREGKHAFNGTPPTEMKLTDPVWEYGRSQGCSITGGYVYRGQKLAPMQGIYLYTDYCNGRVWGLRRGADGQWVSDMLFETATNPSSFGQDQAGELYLLDHRDGKILRLELK